MTRLSQAAAAFLASSTISPRRAGQNDSAAFDLLVRQLADPDIEQLTPAQLRDFLSRWYVEEACARRRSTLAALPEAEALIATLKDFFRWTDRARRPQFDNILDEMAATVPRAVEISVALAAESAERGGAVSFPEFLTTFTEGGQSEYDIGAPTGEVGVREGYFRILSIAGRDVTAEEIIQEERVTPIVFPAAIARLLAPGYILNLELVRTAEGWQIAGSGFAYPPGTEF